MSSIDSNALIGIEEVQRAALIQLFDRLNQKLLDVESYFATQDLALAAHLARDPVSTTLEQIPPENFHEGHHPSLIKASIDAFPNCAVEASRASPAPGTDQLDHQTEFFVALAVEVMLRSSVDETEVVRRARRTAEAVNLVFMDDQTLAGVIHGFSTPNVIWGDVFTRDEQANSAYGPKWFWQGARLEYMVRKSAVMAAANFGVPEMQPFALSGIDQG